jgi:GDPmannose 4,6-dehydratase
MMWMILQAEEAEDWVIATNKTTAVRDFVRMAFGEAGIQLEFKGEGINEVGILSGIDQKKYLQAVGESNNESQVGGHNPDFKESFFNQLTKRVGEDLVRVDPKYFRPTEVDLLIGDASKAKEKLGWVPLYSLDDLVKDMMQSDLKLMKKDQLLREKGYQTLNYFE